MPLLANFEVPERGRHSAAGEASAKMAKAFESVHKAVVSYEVSRLEDEGQVDEMLAYAGVNFSDAAEIFDSMAKEASDLSREIYVNFNWEYLEVGTGLFDDSIGRIGPRFFRTMMSTERELIGAAHETCLVCHNVLKRVGNSSDAAFEANFRSALIDLGRLHSFAVALSEAFAQSLR